MSDFYQGTLRVMDPNGFLLDIGAAHLQVDDPGLGTWSGRLTVSSGSCIDKKSLTSLVETADGTRALAQISPASGSGRGQFVEMAVAGLGEPPF